MGEKDWKVAGLVRKSSILEVGSGDLGMDSTSATTVSREKDAFTAKYLLVLLLFPVTYTPELTLKFKGIWDGQPRSTLEPPYRFAT